MFHFYKFSAGVNFIQYLDESFLLFVDMMCLVLQNKIHYAIDSGSLVCSRVMLNHLEKEDVKTRKNGKKSNFGSKIISYGCSFEVNKVKTIEKQRCLLL